MGSRASWEGYPILFFYPMSQNPKQPPLLLLHGEHAQTMIDFMTKVNLAMISFKLQVLTGASVFL
jgi:hypothetical protein